MRQSGVLSVRSFDPRDLPVLLNIVERSPDYFTEDVPQKLTQDLRSHRGRVVTDGELVVGFCVVDRRSDSAAEILWMAIDPVRRGTGVGTRLLRGAMDELRAEEVSVVEVKTLDPSAGYKPYESTRAFWERHGFVQIDTIDPLPGWQAGNPCALYVAALRTTC
jgi:GNAT superfamily N-acetyltransferase